MHPAKAPASANPAERTFFAAITRALAPGAECWFQARLPGRQGRLTFMADFLLLDSSGVTIIEVKSWHARSIVDADESRVTFRNGRTDQHPLLQAGRYRAALLELLRQAALGQPNIKSVAVLPFVARSEWEGASWQASFPRNRLLLREDMGTDLTDRLGAALPVGGTLLTPEQVRSIAVLLRSGTATPTARGNQGRLL